MMHRLVLSAGILTLFIIMSNCTSDSGSPGPQPETYKAPPNPPMDTGANAVNNNNNDKSLSGNQPYSLKSAMASMMTAMKGIQLTDNFDVDFANLMALHHEAAISMSQLELDGGKDSTMKSIAEKIKAVQQQQVYDLKRLASNSQVTGNRQGKDALQKSMNGMMNGMDTIKVGNNLDSSFARMMKVHHQQGIEMARMELTHGKSRELRQLAQSIVSDAQKEIRQFDNWMKK